MLTPYLSKQLHKQDGAHETLKLLNSNSENPYLVWNNGTRLVDSLKTKILKYLDLDLEIKLIYCISGPI